MAKCPIMSNRYSHGSADCIEDACAWWCAKSCAVAYIGAVYAYDVAMIQREQQEGGDNGNAHD